MNIMANNNKNAYDQFFQKSNADRAKFLLTEAKTDCCFVFEPTESNQPIRRLYSYKWMLSAVSPVFDTMFNGDFKESTSSMDIKIEDISFEDFEMFLSCVYRQTERAYKWPQSFWKNLLYIVDKYMMKGMLMDLHKFFGRLGDPITDFICEKMTGYNSSNILYDKIMLLDPRLGQFDLSTFVDLMVSLRAMHGKCREPLASEESYELIKSYIKQKGYDVNSQDMVEVRNGKDEKGMVLKSQREIIENLLYFAGVDITTFLKDSK